MTTRLLAFFFLASTLSVAQRSAAHDNNAVDHGMVTRIRQEAFRNSKVMDLLAELTDGIGPRLTNSPNHRRAAEWAKQQLGSWGLENARLEPWGPFGQGWSYQRSTARLLKPDVAELIALPKAWSLGTNGPVRGKPVLASIKKKEDFAKYRGKLAGTILFNGDIRDLKPREKPESNRYTDKELDDLFEYDIPGPREKEREPALDRAKRSAFSKELNRFLEQEKVALLVEPGRAPFDGGTMAVQGNAQAYKQGESKGVPVVVLMTEHWNRIARLLKKNVDVETEFDVATTFHGSGDDRAVNVLAEMPGSDLKDEVVMLGAHLDSWHGAAGGTDNAAGVSIMMEAVRILKILGVKPRRTIRIALWSGEEQGLLGSRAWVAEHLAVRPTDAKEQHLSEGSRRQIAPLQLKPEHAKLAAYFNVDSGTGKIRGVRTQENAALVPIFTAWMEPFHDLGMTKVIMQNSGGSDFLSFDAVGLPGIDFEQDEIEYGTRSWHTNMDFYDRVQRDDVMQAAAIVAGFVYHAAMRDQMLPRKPLPQPEPPYSPSETEDKPDDAK